MNERGTTGSLVMTVVVSLLMLGGDIKVASAAADDTAECPCPAAVAEASSGLNHLGISYAKGMQGKRNPQLAMRFFLRAAMQGYTPAMANLGTLYQTGALGRKNFPRAYAWVRAALSFGVPEQDHDITVMKLGMLRRASSRPRLSNRRGSLRPSQFGSSRPVIARQAMKLRWRSMQMY
jgi:hypothetical protein